MNRRGFIGALLATAALDSERLLWIPGRKKIFIPLQGVNDARELVWIFKSESRFRMQAGVYLMDLHTMRPVPMVKAGDIILGCCSAAVDLLEH